MGQFVLVPASVYNKSVTTQSVTKQELPKFKAEQPPTYQIDSLKRDINKTLFGKADTLIDKILSCSRIKLSNSQTIFLDGVDTGVLISDFTLHLRRKNADVPGKLGPFQSLNVRSCKDCIRKVLLLTVLYATCQKLADYQYQMLDSFYIQKILLQNLLWQHENSKE